MSKYLSDIVALVENSLTIEWSYTHDIAQITGHDPVPEGLLLSAMWIQIKAKVIGRKCRGISGRSGAY